MAIIYTLYFLALLQLTTQFFFTKGMVSCYDKKDQKLYELLIWLSVANVFIFVSVLWAAAERLDNL